MYDFLGYFIPGATLIYSFLIINKLGDQGSFSLEETFNNFGNLGFDKVLIFVIFSYLLIWPFKKYLSSSHDFILVFSVFNIYFHLFKM